MILYGFKINVIFIKYYINNCYMIYANAEFIIFISSYIQIYLFLNYI